MIAALLESHIELYRFLKKKVNRKKNVYSMATCRLQLRRFSVP